MPPATRRDPAGGDPFLEEFFQRIPERTARSFSDDQLLAIKMAFSARTWGAHSVDLRLSLPFLLRRYYIVLLMGPERRSAVRRALDRKRTPLATLGNAMGIGVFLAVAAVPVMIIAYTLKTSFNVNLFADTGVHSVLEQLRHQMVTLLKS